MRDNTRYTKSGVVPGVAHSSRDGFVVLTVICAAIVVAMFSLHGASDLLSFGPSLSPQ